MHRMRLAVLILGVSLILLLALHWPGDPQSSAHSGQAHKLVLAEHSLPHPPQPEHSFSPAEQDEAPVNTEPSCERLHDLWNQFRKLRSVGKVPEDRIDTGSMDYLRISAELVAQRAWPELIIFQSQISGERRCQSSRALFAMEEIPDAVLRALLALMKYPPDRDLSLRQAVACIDFFAVDFSFTARSDAHSDTGTEGEEWEFTPDPWTLTIIENLQSQSSVDRVPVDVQRAILAKLKHRLAQQLFNEAFELGRGRAIPSPLIDALSKADELAPDALVYVSGSIWEPLPGTVHQAVVNALMHVNSPVARQILAQLWVRQSEREYVDLLQKTGPEIADSKDFQIGLSKELQLNPSAPTWNQVAPRLSAEQLGNVLSMTVRLRRGSWDDTGGSRDVGIRAVSLLGRVALEDPAKAEKLAEIMRLDPGWAVVLKQIQRSTPSSASWSYEFNAGLSLFKQ